MTCTAFKNIFDKTHPHFLSIDAALDRIRAGKSKDSIEKIRSQIDKERINELKKHLPCICFSGKFSERKDDKIIQHSGFIVLDFDHVADLRDLQTEIINHDFVYACWVSPGGNGLKALVKIANGKKHREHFGSLKELFPSIDDSGKNESRVCYESYDPEIYINTNAKPYIKIKQTEKFQIKEGLKSENEIFNRIFKWLSNRGDAFVTGERNNFVFKLASACCRFGIHIEDASVLIRNELNFAANTFSDKEGERAIKSAYKANISRFGSAVFEKDVLVDKVSRSEIEIDQTIFDESIKPKDVIFGEDVKENALKIYDVGYEKVQGLGIAELDAHFKFKRGEITLLSGIGNYGKSTFWHWIFLMRVLKYDERFALFSPENNPPEEFYHDFVEVLFGMDCTPNNSFRITKKQYEKAFDFISSRIFYVYPKDIAPTPEYIKERFLELIIKQKVDGVIIDPFNQLANDYGKSGGRSDKYLETFLSDCGRFAQMNNVFFTIVAHPKAMRKDPDGNYPAPDKFDIADGAMWNNKMDNILIYHRPKHQKEPQSPHCELKSIKIRRQKQVGKLGAVDFELLRATRRFYFNDVDVMQSIINEKNIDFLIKKSVTKPTEFKKVEVVPIDFSMPLNQQNEENKENEEFEEAPF